MEGFRDGWCIVEKLKVNTYQSLKIAAAFIALIFGGAHGPVERALRCSDVEITDFEPFDEIDIGFVAGELHLLAELLLEGEELAD